METVLENLIPKIIGCSVSYRVNVFQGKRDLIRKLPDRLRGYKKWPPNDWKIVVLIDKDSDDCLKLKHNLEKMAKSAGFPTKTKPSPNGFFNVINRIAVEELEAWFFGDWKAVCEAYPRVPKNLRRKRGFADPDSISGGTWEKLEKILQDAGYFKGGLSKTIAAGEISRFMLPERNDSRSFQVFCNGLLETIKNGN